MNTKRKACLGKRRLTKDAAFTAARATWGEKQLRAYECHYCGGWHLARHKAYRLEHLFELIGREAHA
jgi:hypothetical protein